MYLSDTLLLGCSEAVEAASLRGQIDPLLISIFILSGYAIRRIDQSENLRMHSAGWVGARLSVLFHSEEREPAF